MKIDFIKYLMIFLAVCLIGIFAIFLPFMFSPKSVPARQQTELSKVVSKQSNTATITEPELSFDEVEPELYDKNQMYFKYSDGMYNYLKLSQVDKIKDQLQLFIKNNLSANISECEFDIDSVDNSEDIISFTVKISGYSDLDIVCKKDETGNITDINISQNEK